MSLNVYDCLICHPISFNPTPVPEGVSNGATTEDGGRGGELAEKQYALPEALQIVSVFAGGYP
jgi:hypothetical protein